MSGSFHGELFDYGKQDVERKASAPYQKHSPTSRAAAAMIEPVAGTQRANVLELIRAKGDQGATDEEIQLKLGLKTNSELPRRVELARAGFIKDSGRTRPNISKMEAVVWVALTQEERNNFVPVIKKKTCGWREEAGGMYWQTECEEAHYFEADGPKENKYKFCPYCGKKIEE